MTSTQFRASSLILTIALGAPLAKAASVAAGSRGAFATGSLKASKAAIDILNKGGKAVVRSQPVYIFRYM